MSNDVSISFGSDADKLKQSLEALSDSVTTLKDSLTTTAGQSQHFNDKLNEMEEAAKKAATAQQHAWGELAKGVNHSLEIVKKSIAGLQTSFAYLREGDEIAKAGQTFKAFTRSVGKDSETMILALRKATQNQVSDLELMQSAITAMKTGVATDTEELSKLFEIANAKADLFGLSVVESFNTITRAIATGKKEAFVSLDLLPKRLLDASNSADLLKNRTQLLYEVLRHGEKDVKMLSQIGTNSADSFAQLETSIKNLSASVKKDLSGSLMPLVDYVRTDAVPVAKYTLELVSSSASGLKRLDDAMGLLNTTMAATAGYIAGMAIGKLVSVFGQLATAISAAASAQISFNTSVLANPLGLKFAVLALTGYAAKVKWDEWQVDNQTFARNRELAEQNEKNSAGRLRTEIAELENKLQTQQNIFRDMTRNITSVEQMSDAQFKYSQEVDATALALRTAKERLAEIGKEQQKVFDTRRVKEWGAELAGLNNEILADRMMRFAIGDLYDGSFAESLATQTILNKREAEKEAEKVLKRLEEIKKQSASAFAGAFGATELDLKRAIDLMHKAGMAAMGYATRLDQLNPELVKFLDEMQELSDRDDRISAVHDALHDISKLDFSKVARDIGFLSDIPAVQATLTMMNQLSGGLMAAPGVAPVKQESAVAQMLYATSGGLIGYYGRNVFEQQFKARFADVKSAAKDVKNEFSDAIANAITEGFTRADFSGFAQSLGAGLSSIVSGALGDTVSSLLNQKNMGSLTSGGGLFKPIYTKNAAGTTSLNWGNLGINLGTSAAVSFLTSPGRLFGGSVVHGQEHFNTSTSLNEQVNQAKDLRDLMYIQAGISETTRSLLDAAQFAYTWVRKTKSGDGIFSKKTTTYLLEGSAEAQASIDNIKALQKAVMGEQAKRSYYLWQISRNDNLQALQMSVDDASHAYTASLVKNTNSQEVQALRAQQDQYKTALSTWKLNQTLVNQYQAIVQDLQNQIDAISVGYKYSEAERIDTLRAYKQAEIDLVSAIEAKRTNLVAPFLADVSLAGMVTPDLLVQMLGDKKVAGTSETIQALLPLMERAGYQGYDLSKAFAEAGSDPIKQLEIYKQQQEVFKGALSTYEKLAVDAKAEALNTSLSVEAQAAAFERWQETFDAFLRVQEQIEQNTRTIADIEKQNLLTNIAAEISDALTIFGEFIDQKGGDRLFIYRQPTTKDEMLAMLKELYATRDPEKYALIQKIIDDAADLVVWGG